MATITEEGGSSDMDMTFVVILSKITKQLDLFTTFNININNLGKESLDTVASALFG